MNNYIIETRSLTKQFNAKTALKNFDLTITAGGIHAIIGANGAGKSTLFRILLGLEQPTSGHSFILGTESSMLTPAQRGEIGYVNEEHTLPNWMTAAEVTKMQRRLYPNWCQDIYDSVIGNFDVQASQKISMLSRGERAGLNLSMALAQAPKILILDEPTLGLDVVAKQAFLEALMYTETDLDTTIIYCSHQMEEIERVAENLIIIENGEVKYLASPDEFCERITGWIIDFDGDANILKQLPGIVSVKYIEGQYHLVFADQSTAALTEQFAKLSVTDATQIPMSLDKAISSVLAQNHRSPQKAA